MKLGSSSIAVEGFKSRVCLRRGRAEQTLKHKTGLDRQVHAKSIYMDMAICQDGVMHLDNRQCDPRFQAHALFPYRLHLPFLDAPLLISCSVAESFLPRCLRTLQDWLVTIFPVSQGLQRLLRASRRRELPRKGAFSNKERSSCLFALPLVNKIGGVFHLVSSLVEE